jgi:hypothetical protein
MSVLITISLGSATLKASDLTPAKQTMIIKAFASGLGVSDKLVQIASLKDADAPASRRLLAVFVQVRVLVSSVAQARELQSKAKSTDFQAELAKQGLNEPATVTAVLSTGAASEAAGLAPGAIAAAVLVPLFFVIIVAVGVFVYMRNKNGKNTVAAGGGAQAPVDTVTVIRNQAEGPAAAPGEGH